VTHTVSNSRLVVVAAVSGDESRPGARADPPRKREPTRESAKVPQVLKEGVRPLVREPEQWKGQWTKSAAGRKGPPDSTAGVHTWYMNSFTTVPTTGHRGQEEGWVAAEGVVKQ